MGRVAWGALRKLVAGLPGFFVSREVRRHPGGVSTGGGAVCGLRRRSGRGCGGERRVRGELSEAEGSALRRPGLGEAAGRPAGPQELLGGPTQLPGSRPTPEKARERGSRSPLEGAGGRALRSARCPGGWSRVCSPGPPGRSALLVTPVILDLPQQFVPLTHFFHSSDCPNCVLQRLTLTSNSPCPPG